VIKTGENAALDALDNFTGRLLQNPVVLVVGGLILYKVLFK